MYELAWQEIDRKGYIINKRKAFKSSRARTAFVEKLLEKNSFYRTLATCDPE